MTAQDLVELVRGVKSDFEREEDQGLMQHDLHKAEQALAGKYACDRILRAITMRTGIQIIEPRGMGRAR